MWLVLSKMDDGNWEKVAEAYSEAEAQQIKREMISDGFDGTLTVVAE